MTCTLPGRVLQEQLPQFRPHREEPRSRPRTLWVPGPRRTLAPFVHLPSHGSWCTALIEQPTLRTPNAPMCLLSQFRAPAVLRASGCECGMDNDSGRTSTPVADDVKSHGPDDSFVFSDRSFLANGRNSRSAYSGVHPSGESITLGVQLAPSSLLKELPIRYVSQTYAAFRATTMERRRFSSMMRFRPRLQRWYVPPLTQIDAGQFSQSIQAMNRTLEDAANPTYGLLDNILTNMTFQLWPLVAGTHYRRVRTHN